MKNHWYKVLALLLGCMLLLAVPAAAAVYDLQEIGVTIEMDETAWYIFTRDNLIDNPELEFLGFTEEEMNTLFETDGAYMIAFIVLSEDLGDMMTMELSVEFYDDSDGDMIYESDSTLLELAESSAQMLSEYYQIEDYSVYTTAENKYIKIEASEQNDEDGSTDYTIFYSTTVNGDVYSLNFYHNASTDATALIADVMMELVVDSVTYDMITPPETEAAAPTEPVTESVGNITPSPVTPSDATETDTDESEEDGPDIVAGISFLLVGAVLIVVAVLILVNMNGKKQKRTQTSYAPTNRPTGYGDYAYCRTCGCTIPANEEYCTNCKPKQKKFGLKSIAVGLFGIQAFSLLGTVMGGLTAAGPAWFQMRLEAGIDPFEAIGFFIPTIIGVILLIVHTVRKNQN